MNERPNLDIVLNILQSVNLKETAPKDVRRMTADILSLDLLTPERKRFVREVIDPFHTQINNKEQHIREEKHDLDEEQLFNNDGNPIFCSIQVHILSIDYFSFVYVNFS